MISVSVLKRKRRGSLEARLDLLRDATDALTQEIRMLDLPRGADMQRGIDLFDEVRRYEVGLIRQALSHAGGSQVHAARLLNLNTTTLNSKIKRLNITLDRERSVAGGRDEDG